MLIALPCAALIYAVIDLADQGRRIAATAGWPAAALAELLHLPLVMAQLMPVALLLALTLWLSGLRRRGELEAMAAVGASPLSIALPALVVGAIAGAGGHLLAEVAAPPCERAADRLIGHPRRSALTGLDERRPGWRRSGPWLVHRRTASRASVLALELGPDHRVRTRLEGTSGERDDRLEGVTRHALDRGAWRRHRPPGPVRLPALRRLAGTWTPVRAEARSAGELSRTLRHARAGGLDRPAELLVLQTKRAYPLFCLVAALFALGAGFGPPRGRGALADLGRCAASLVLLWLLLAGGWTLARAGLLGPTAGAWAPLLAGGLLGGWLAARQTMRIG